MNTQSYFNTNVEWVQRSALASETTAFKDLFVSFLTIQNYRDLLFDPSIHLRNDISPDFIDNIMIPDFSTVIIKLRDYSGNDRKGIQQAYNLMDQALRELYKTHTGKDLVDTIMDCRNKLHEAYQQLGHWNQHTAKMPPL